MKHAKVVAPHHDAVFRYHVAAMRKHYPYLTHDEADHALSLLRSIELRAACLQARPDIIASDELNDMQRWLTDLRELTE